MAEFDGLGIVGLKRRARRRRQRGRSKKQEESAQVAQMLPA
jgi:hypothetical protein